MVRSGTNVELVCHAEGSPPPTLTWTRKAGNGGMLPSIEGEESPSLTTPTLRIPSVQRGDAGVYECEASNGVGEAATAQLKLQVICECVLFRE